MFRLSRIFPRYDRMPVLMLLPALAATLPVVALAIASMHDAESQARTHITNLLRARVERLASDGVAFVGSATRTAEFLASRPEVQAAPASACERFAGIETIDASWSRVAVLDVDGRVLCDSRTTAARERTSYAGDPWLERALRSRRAVVGTMERAPKLGLHVAAVARDASNRPVAVVMIEIDPVAFSKALGGTELPPGSSMVINDRADRIVARFPDPERWIGTDASAKRAAFAAASPGGYGEVPGLDGVDRLFLELPLPSLGWHASAGVPMELVRAPARSALRESLGTLVAAVLAGVVLAGLLARRISRPLDDLAHTAEEVAAGATSTRAAVPAGGELRAVAEQFNRMLDQRERVEADLRSTGRLFEAIARANAALGRGGRFEDVARDICAACVDTGFALRIGVLLKHDAGARLVATAGPIAPWDKFRDAWDHGDFGPPDMPVPMALLSGQPAVLNDIPRDQLRGRIAEYVDELGLQSMAALPLRLHDRIWGALLVHGGRPGWFDEHRMHVFTVVANDLAQSLNHAELEAARARAEQEVHERDRQMAGIVETAFEAVVAVDREQRVRVFNPAAARMFGVDAAQAIGEPLDRFIPLASRGAHREHVEAFAQEGAKRRMHGMTQLTGLRADGTEFPIEATIASHAAGEGGVLMTAFIRDLSEVMEAQQARAAQVAAEAANDAKTLFLANVSHELRTPIHAVLGFTELALATDLNPRQYDYLQKATLAADALLAVVNQILDFCDLEAGKLRIDSVEFALRELVDPLRAGVEQRARARHLDFRVEIDPALPARLRGDRVRLLQVLVNLASNAVKFTSAGEVAVQLAASEWRGDERVRMHVNVRDTGIGMEPQELERVFEPFVQSDVSSARRYGGTGLGLAITRQLVERLGGTLRAESSPGRGSEFSFDVWLDVPAAPRPVARSPAAPSAGLRGRRVLVVDDNPLNLELAQVLLGDLAQMDVTTAEGGAEGVRLLQAQPFEVVVLDIQMPGMDGYDTARAIRALPGPMARVPIVAFTAFASDDVRRACLDAGMDDCVGKAGGEKPLLAALSRALNA